MVKKFPKPFLLLFIFKKYCFHLECPTISGSPLNQSGLLWIKWIKKSKCAKIYTQVKFCISIQQNIDYFIWNSVQIAVK
jgi:hypothetical protein